MARQCTACGTVYENDDADFCNACGGEDLRPVLDVDPRPPTAERLRDDPYSLAVAMVLWVAGLSYVLGHRAPRTWAPLAYSWLFLTVAGLIAGLILNNTRTFYAFSAFGAVFVLVYALVKLT